MTEVVLPWNNWRPRPYQLDAWNYLASDGKRFMGVWHRRAGKDEILLHRAACAMVERPASYWHMLPEKEQARKAIWESINPHTGRRRIDEAFPEALFKKRETDMLIRCKANGATWQVLGSDNFQSLVGTPPYGITSSETALARPGFWGYLRPILRENGGWIAMISTPRGKNHFHDWMVNALKDDDWHVSKINALQSGVFTPHELVKERQSYIDDYGETQGESLFNQEYMISFEAAVLGAYYAKELANARDHGRVGEFPIDPSQPVHTAWDLGMSDATAIWLFQVIGKRVRCVWFTEDHGKALADYATMLRKKRIEEQFRFGTHFLPHDAAARELGTGRTREETLRACFSLPADGKVRILTQMSLMDGINAARQTIYQAEFDAEGVADGLHHLSEYKEDYDDKNRVFRGRPKHDEHSHGADAFRYLAASWRIMNPEAGVAIKRPGRYNRQRDLPRGSLWTAD